MIKKWGYGPPSARGPRRGLVRVAAARAAGAAGVSTPAATAAALVATGRSTGRPGVLRGSSAAALLAAAGASAPAAALLAAATAAVTALATSTGGLGDLGRGVLQAGADFLDVQLVDRALDALTVLVGPLLQPALHDDAHASLERLGDVLRRLTPDRAGQEQALAVLPLIGLTVEGAGVDATRNFATAAPEGVKRSSGSSTRLPTTVMTVSPAMGEPLGGFAAGC